MDVGTNDLVYNQGTQKLYASIPSGEGSTGNSIAEIDPAMGAITTQVFVGSEPTQLAQYCRFSRQSVSHRRGSAKSIQFSIASRCCSFR
jgi:hypothetical protein